MTGRRIPAERRISSVSSSPGAESKPVWRTPEFVPLAPLYVLLLMANVALGFFVPQELAPGKVVRAIVVFTIFTAAYVAEIVRGGLQSLPPGQEEAAKALGLSPTRTTFLIVVPQALRNVIDVLAEAGARPQHVCRMTAYCCDKPAYLAARPQLGRVWQALMGRHYPAMSMIFVSDLLDSPGKIELEATAVIPGEK